MSYQGWATRETWNVALWFGNEEPLYRSVLRYAERNGRFTASSAKLFVLESLPNGTPDFKSPREYDKVKWSEIAADFNEMAGHRIKSNPLPPSDRNLEAMFHQYIATALWSTNDESDESGGEPLDKNYSSGDIDFESLEHMARDVRRFAKENDNTIRSALAKGGKRKLDWASVGHDFWLTRNGHGAGFWDGDWPEPEATALTKASEKFGTSDLYVGDDGHIHVSRSNPMFSGVMDTMNETFEALDNPLGRGGKTVLVVGATAAILGGLFWWSKKASAATTHCASWRTPANGEMTPSVVSRANQLDSGANLGKEYVESYDGKTWQFNVVKDPNNPGQTDVWVKVCAG